MAERRMALTNHGVLRLEKGCARVCGCPADMLHLVADGKVTSLPLENGCAAGFELPVREVEAAILTCSGRVVAEGGFAGRRKLYAAALLGLPCGGRGGDERRETIPTAQREESRETIPTALRAEPLSKGAISVGEEPQSKGAIKSGEERETSPTAQRAEPLSNGAISVGEEPQSKGAIKSGVEPQPEGGAAITRDILRRAEMLFRPLDAAGRPQEGAPEPFPGRFPGAKWRRVDYPGTGRYYLEGIWWKNGVKLLLHALPGQYSPRPPRSLKGFDKFLPGADGNGYWLRVRRG